MGYRVQGPVAYSPDRVNTARSSTKPFETDQLSFVLYTDFRATGLFFEQKLSSLYPGDIHSDRVCSWETGRLAWIIVHVAKLRTSGQKSKRASVRQKYEANVVLFTPRGHPHAIPSVHLGTQVHIDIHTVATEPFTFW